MAEVMTPGSAAFIAIIGTWLILAVFGNFCVILVVIRNKKMRTVTNIFICNLALSDIFLAAFVLPQNIHDLSHTDDYHEGLLACKLVNMLPVFCITCSIYSLVAMSFERVRAVVYHTRQQLSLRAAKVISVSIWIFSVILSVPTAVEYGLVDLNITEIPTTTVPVTDVVSESYYADSSFGLEPNTTLDADHPEFSSLECGSERSFTYSLTNGILLLLISYLIPMAAMIVNYSMISYFVVKKSSELREDGSSNAFNTIIKRRVRIVKMLVIVAILFVICWMPYFTLLMIQKITGNDGTSNAAGMINMLRVTLAVFSTSYNSVLYMIYNPNFRDGFKSLLCSCCSKKFSQKVAPLEDVNKKNMDISLTHPQT